jgi:farnesol dehydrogenase
VILVTGGSGYLGQAVVRRLVGAGRKVRLLVRRDLHLGEAPGGVDIRLASLSDPAALHRCMEGCRQIVHMAALVRRWSPRPEQFDDVNVRGLVNLLEAARRHGIERFVYTSSFLALGPTDGGAHDEDAARRDLPAGNLYAHSKRRAEEVARQAAASGAPVVTLYPGIMYGPGPRTQGNLVGEAIIRYLRGRLPGLVGGGARRWCMAHVEDVAQGHLAALDTAPAGSRYILGGENLSLKEILERVDRLVGVFPPPPRSIPSWAARLAGRWNLWRAALGGPAPEITPDEVEVYRHDWAYSSDRARRELGYEITPFERGLAATIEWARSEIRDLERGR